MSVTFTYFPKALPALRTEDATSFFLDPDVARKLLIAAERASFDAVVVDDPAGALSNIDLSAAAVGMTTSLRVVTTHWTGVMGPEEAASQFAALSHRSGSRISLRISTEDAGRIGEEKHVEAKRRTQEYIMLLWRLWLSEKPFHHEGPYHSIQRAELGPLNRFGRDITFRMGGCSGAALDVAGRYADVFELEPASLFDLRTMIRRVTAAATPYGREARIRFALPITVLGHGILEDRHAHPGCTLRIDDPARAALSLMPFVEEGVTDFMMRGLDDVDSLGWFGHKIAPILRNSAARHGNDGPSGIGKPWAAARGTNSARVRWRSSSPD